jgi:uncharacterized protein (TIGR03435 family)
LIFRAHRSKFSSAMAFCALQRPSAAGRLALAMPLAIGLFDPSGILGQSPPVGAPQFEVASVKRMTPPGDSPGVMSSGCDFLPGRVECQACLKDLIVRAYEITDDRILGPQWLTSQHAFESDMYAVVAKIPAGASQEQARLMLQTLLADRFKLVSHREKKSLPVYALVVDEKGAKLKKSSGPTGQMSVGMTSFDSPNMSIEELVGMLRHGTRLGDVLLDRPIVDMTHLDGRFEIKLEWAPDRVDGALGNRPDLPTALREQLGLKLLKQNAMIDVLVVDHAEKTPTEN